MSTVTKPVMLNETGQQIKGTLEEIRDAITGSGSTHYPVRIVVATPPEKVDYIVGETLDLTGIVVNAIYDNGVPYDVTADCTFSPDDGDTLTASDTEITATYVWTLGQQTQTFHATRAISVSSVQSISVTTPPNTVDYNAGDTLDLTGMVVKATMSNGSQIDVTSQCTFDPDDGDTLSASDTEIEVTLTVSGSTYTASQAITVTVPIYGVEWDGSSSPAFTRTDAAVSFTDPVPQMSDGNGGWTQGSSPFDTISPWKDMTVVDDSNAGKVVKIPKFYFKRTINNSTGAYKLQISPIKIDSSWICSPAHMDRSDGQGERDYVYVGKYPSSLAVSYKSMSGVGPTVSTTAADFRTAIHNLGSDIWQCDKPMFETIQMLYLVEFANWDSQAVIGAGCGGTSVVNTGNTDDMTYHTGTTASSRDSVGFILYRNIEGLWSNVYNIVDGWYVDNSICYVILDPNDFGDASKGVSTLVPSLSDATHNNFKKMQQSSVSGLEWFSSPVEKNDDSTNTTYICDNGTVSAEAGAFMICGGAGAVKSQFGLFNLSNSTNGSPKCGSRLMKLPANA